VPIAGVAPGDVVVVLAASSAVGLSALQIARDAGATVVAVSRTSSRREELLSQGAEHFVALEEED
jgi:NADPH:quinone reductase-like Zn-dependent oxidoreductase